MATDANTAASSGRSGGDGASADSYIGSLISLTSKSEIRYEGVLYNINTEESSIGLRNVRSFGTEGRKKDGPQVPHSDKIYEYILFRGTDIKVKASPPVQTTPPVNNDPAIIQALALSTSDSPTYKLAYSGLPLYQPGGNLNSWGPTPPNAMYWQGFYGTPNALPQLSQQSLLRPPFGMPITPTSSSSLPSSSLPASTLSMNIPPMQPVSLASEIMTNLLPNKAPVSAVPTSLLSSSLPSLAPFSVPDNAGTTSKTSKNVVPGPAAVTEQTVSRPVTSNAGTSGFGLVETPPPLITPGHLLQSGPSTASAPQSLQTTHKDVEVVQVSSKPVAELPAPVATEAQPPILPLPPNARAHKALIMRVTITEGVGEEDLSLFTIRTTSLTPFSSNALNNDPNHGRTRYSKQIKLTQRHLENIQGIESVEEAGDHIVVVVVIVGLPMEEEVMDM
ncbi:hypothetical protein SASPL_118738 [Salvia splendens]|uniref:Lsm14-like N-terminal domain-containing protein n=1 Tax=Salvia splendens TaxID=180675 RepID=A0A8X8XXA5_SALSN|nr:hypothetical protein SASPL_118738 [Salvia splendens]